VLYPYREQFKGLDAKDWECILRSAIEVGKSLGKEFVETDVTNWLKVVSTIDATLLSKAIVEPLIADLQNPDHKRVHSDAAESLATIGKYGGSLALEPLIIALQDDDSFLRWNAAIALGELGNVKAVEPLISALQDEDSSVRASVAKALGKLGDKRVIEPLLVALQNKNWGAAKALGQLGDPRAFEPLITMLKDSDSNLRRWAAWGLGSLGDIRAVEPLIASLYDELNNGSNFGGRLGQIIALGDLRDNRAILPFVTILHHNDYTVRQDLAVALGKIGDMSSLELLTLLLQDKNYYVRQEAAKSLDKINNVNQIRSG
jgi:hypothetical protein